MRKNLIDRLEALESAQQSMNSAVAGAEQNEIGAKVVAEIIADLNAEQAVYDALDAAGRIQHWQKRIEEARRYIENYSDHAPPLRGGSQRNSILESLNQDLWESDLQDARNDVRGGECWFELTAARLDRLAELDYDQSKLDAWNTVRRRYEKLPWQWRPEYLELPHDALRLLSAKSGVSKARGRVH